MTLRLDGVARTVGAEVHIHPTTLELAPGSLNVLLGPTLAGKTTLMRLMAGLDRPSVGRILLDGEDVTGVSVRRRDVAMVYQQFINYPSFTVYENIASPLRRAGLARDEIDRRVRSTAEMLHIEGLLDRLPAELSGGQQQRTALARAMVKRASLLLLDEPLVNLDYKLREELREELRTVFEAHRAIVVYATTEPHEALAIGGTAVVLDEGRALQSGATHEVFRRPTSVRVGQIFSDPPINLIDGRIEGDMVDLGRAIHFARPPQMARLAAGPYRFGVRANNLNLWRRPGDDLVIAGAVELAEISGSETFVHASHDGVLWVVQEEGVHEHRLGQAIEVFSSSQALFVFAADGTLAAAPADATAARQGG